MKKAITIFGSTGSVGQSALAIVREKRDCFDIGALVANSNAEQLLEQAIEFMPAAICLFSAKAADSIKDCLPNGVELLVGKAGLMQAAVGVDAELILAASSGSASLQPVLSALGEGRDIAVANKEILVMAGGLFMQEQKKIIGGFCLWTASTTQFFSVWRV